jgi:hypothetical protein
MPNLLLFVILQVSDLATTLWFLSRGVEEGNPLVAGLIRVSASPALSLALLKAVACGLAYLAWKRNRRRLLGRINLLFAVCVGWNLVAIARATG